MKKTTRTKPQTDENPHEQMNAKPRNTKPAPDETEKPIFRDPTPQEIAEAWESISSWAFDNKTRDMELADFWEEHCMDFAVAKFKKASVN